MPEGNPEGYNVPGNPASGEKNGNPGPEDVLKAVNTMQQGLQAMLQSGAFPDEAMQMLGQAVDAYNNFVSMISGGGQKGAVPMQGGAENAAGNKNAVPAMSQT